MAPSRINNSLGDIRLFMWNSKETIRLFNWTISRRYSLTVNTYTKTYWMRFLSHLFLKSVFYFFTVFFFLGIGRLRVGANSPSRWPSLSWVISIGNQRIPLYTWKRRPILDGVRKLARFCTRISWEDISSITWEWRKIGFQTERAIFFILQTFTWCEYKRIAAFRATGGLPFSRSWFKCNWWAPPRCFTLTTSMRVIYRIPCNSSNRWTTP